MALTSWVASFSFLSTLPALAPSHSSLSSAHWTTRKLFTFFHQLGFLRCGGLFQSSVEPDTKDIVHRKERWCEVNPARSAYPSTQKPQDAPTTPSVAEWAHQTLTNQLLRGVAAVPLVAAGPLWKDGIDYGCLKSFEKLALLEKEGRCQVKLA